MTKSTITREESVQAVFDLKVGYRLGFADIEILKRVARMALAAMDSEPVVVVGDDGGDALSYRRLIQSFEPGTKLYRHAQPAPVVPEEWTIADAVKFCKETGRQDAGAAMDAWNACRAAMLQAGNSPAQSDCCPAQNSVTPAQGGNSLVIPDEMTSGQAYEIGYYYGDPVDVFARGANWMRQHIIDSTLAAAPQLPGSEPATVPGKWIPVSERMPEVGDIVLTAMGGVVNVGEMECSAANCRFFTSVISGRELPATHWMPLPAGPQEVK